MGVWVYWKAFRVGARGANERGAGPQLRTGQQHYVVGWQPQWPARRTDAEGVLGGAGQSGGRVEGRQGGGEAEVDIDIDSADVESRELLLLPAVPRTRLKAAQGR